ncbi:hypothetical protein SK128_019355 [Halocaridina rubra]|uniref:Uncharacterized protein n=1 Tax=Halocaridina rubra TaxID=373956 RepID=A0AAN9AE22_HALRR
MIEGSAIDGLPLSKVKWDGIKPNGGFNISLAKEKKIASSRTSCTSLESTKRERQEKGPFSPFLHEFFPFVKGHLPFLDIFSCHRFTSLVTELAIFHAI